MVGNACLEAARELASQVARRSRAAGRCSARRGAARQGAPGRPRRQRGRRMSIAEAFQLAEARFGTLGAVGWYTTPKDVHGDYRGGTIGASPAYSFTAHVAEVDVDVETGIVAGQEDLDRPRLRRRAQPDARRGADGGQRLHGLRRGALRGAGLQARRACTTGRRCSTTASRPRSTRRSSSRSSSSRIDPEGPYGAKEAGEGPLHPSIPAIANAIYDAVGVRLTAAAVHARQGAQGAARGARGRLAKRRLEGCRSRASAPCAPALARRVALDGRSTAVLARRAAAGAAALASRRRHRPRAQPQARPARRRACWCRSRASRGCAAVARGRRRLAPLGALHLAAASAAMPLLRADLPGARATRSG